MENVLKIQDNWNNYVATLLKKPNKTAIDLQIINEWTKDKEAKNKKDSKKFHTYFEQFDSKKR
jgi:hypothetical protein